MTNNDSTATTNNKNQPPSRILITGANTGLGFECARQLASQSGVEKIILGCRSQERAEAAKQKLQGLTGKDESFFQIALMDVANLDSVRKAAAKLSQEEDYIDGLVLNAGGLGGLEPRKLTEDSGVTFNVAVNVLGHVLLVDELIKANKIRGDAASVVLSGSEAARGVTEMNVPPPTLQSGSVEEFQSICDGSFFPDGVHENSLYSLSKLLAALWMSHMAQKHPKIRFVTISPGFTSGTDAVRDKSFLRRVAWSVLTTTLTYLGKCNSLQTGTKRYVDALLDRDNYKSGVFYASLAGKAVGEVCDQSEILSYFANAEYQENAYKALCSFIYKKSMK